MNPQYDLDLEDCDSTFLKILSSGRPEVKILNFSCNLQLINIAICSKTKTLPLR